MKCHKFEINLRKEVFREITRLNNELARTKKYLRSCYTTNEWAYTNEQVSQLTAQLSLLTTLVEEAKSTVS